MDTNPRQRAIARIEALKREIESLEEFVSLYDKLSHVLGFENSGNSPAMSSAFDDPLDRPTPQSELHDMARAALKEENRPLTTAELFEKLTEAGAVIGGKSPMGNLSAKLNHAPDLVNRKDEGWWFVTPEGSPKKSLPTRLSADSKSRISRSLNYDTPEGSGPEPTPDQEDS